MPHSCLSIKGILYILAPPEAVVDCGNKCSAIFCTQFLLISLLKSQKELVYVQFFHSLLTKPFFLRVSYLSKINLTIVRSLHMFCFSRFLFITAFKLKKKKKRKNFFFPSNYLSDFLSNYLSFPLTQEGNFS